MSIKKGYYYLFYKLYKFSEAAPSKWLSEWKASLVLDVFIYLIFLSIGGYYSIITKKDMLPVMKPKLVILLIVVGVVSINYFVFNHQDKWRIYVAEFDRWGAKKNKIGSIVVGVIIFLIIANLLFMFYLLSQIDWKQYR